MYINVCVAIILLRRSKSQLPEHWQRNENAIKTGKAYSPARRIAPPPPTPPLLPQQSNTVKAKDIPYSVRAKRKITKKKSNSSLITFCVVGNAMA